MSYRPRSPNEGAKKALPPHFQNVEQKLSSFKTCFNVIKTSVVHLKQSTRALRLHCAESSSKCREVARLSPGNCAGAKGHRAVHVLPSIYFYCYYYYYYYYCCCCCCCYYYYYYYYYYGVAAPRDFTLSSHVTYIKRNIFWT